VLRRAHPHCASVQAICSDWGVSVTTSNVGSTSAPAENGPVDELQADLASTARVLAMVLTPFVIVAEDLGIHPDVVLASVGFSRTDLENPELRISHALTERLMAETLAQTKERDLGLLAAERLRPQHLDFLEYVLRSQKTFGEAIELANRYYVLMHEGLERRTELTDEHFTMRFGLGSLPPLATVLEYTLALHVLVPQRVVGQANFLMPLEVHFPTPEPEKLTNHRRLFGERARLLFGQSDYAIVYPRALLGLPTTAPDIGLARVLERHADESLQKLGLSANLIERVRELVRQDLTTGKLTADSLARRLGMSSRTLHRRLLAQQSSYRAILDEVRREIALRCLRDPHLSIREVGVLLGFTTGPAFHRAFRRWTGTTAAAFRNQCLHGQSS